VSISDFPPRRVQNGHHPPGGRGGWGGGRRGGTDSSPQNIIAQPKAMSLVDIWMPGMPEACGGVSGDEWRPLWGW